MFLKKITALASAFVLAVGTLAFAVPITASAESDFELYTYDNGDNFLSGYTGKGGDVRIPDGVQSIALAFYANKDITSITIPASCRSIGNGAFAYCANLKEVIIEGDARIYGYAFKGCPSLEKVTVKGSVIQIGDKAFADCGSLKTVRIGKNEYEFEIGEKAFYNCYSLTSVNIPDKCSRIYDGAFTNCFSLTSLTIPEKTLIEDYATGLNMGMYELYSAYDVKNNGSEPGMTITGTADGKTSGYALKYYSVNEKKTGYNIEDTESIVWLYKGYTPKALTLTVTPNSDAEWWAIKNNIKYVYADGSKVPGSSYKSEKLSAPSGIKASKSYDKITLRWNKVKGADGYVICMYNEKTGRYEIYKAVTGTECTISGLEKGTKYKLRIASLVNGNDRFAVQTSSGNFSVTTLG